MFNWKLSIFSIEINYNYIGTFLKNTTLKTYAYILISEIIIE
jgi:hypothetical protein